MKFALKLLSPAGARARLSVLIFHRVLAQPDALFPDETDARRFDEMMGWVKSMFQVLPLDEAAQRLQAGTLPACAAALTFDDGYADNHDQALPILRRHGLPCSFFVATGFLDGGRMWNDTLIESVRACESDTLDLRGLLDGQGQDLGVHALSDIAARRLAVRTLIARIKYLPPQPRAQLVAEIAARSRVQLPDDLMMSSDQVRALHRAGMQIGAHTVSHPILASLDPLDARAEIQQSKNALESLLGERVSLFAYPNGKPGADYLPQQHPAMVRELGFEAAVSTQWGASRKGDDGFQIRRFTPWDRSKLKFGVRMMRNLGL